MPHHVCTSLALGGDEKLDDQRNEASHDHLPPQRVVALASVQCSLRVELNLSLGVQLVQSFLDGYCLATSITTHDSST
jgi:hypothetical protein